MHRPGDKRGGKSFGQHREAKKSGGFGKPKGPRFMQSGKSGQSSGQKRSFSN